ncbi:hypothetical protein [Paenirhodobacter populi]|uniref:hypothetical protein n=1 Tax=Paenirhodobacter populi TaxID=2306993 RepID=UPI000FE3E7AF|nr:hypothetical protein [Sinirhodobacter populi]RWR09728.1 hypothetical protein D2T32_05125 [Sinirhodobacter populi]
MSVYRAPPALCEACNLFPCVGLGVTFDWSPDAVPPFPWSLRYAVLWICGHTDCEATARRRAAIAARREGVRAPRTTIVRVKISKE